MGRGIYSALGRWPREELPSVLTKLHALAERITAGEEIDEPHARAALAAIRAFEARVGCACGVAAEQVATPEGPAIELGNIGHRAFGAEHEDAARVVAEALRAVLEAYGASGAFAFTID